MPAEELGPQSGKIGAACNDKSVCGCWHVAQSRSRGESRAITRLERQGYCASRPRYRKTVQHARKAKHVLAPLFPNYLFLRLHALRDLWRAPNGAHGVARLIWQGETPTPHEGVEGLSAKADADGVMKWTPSFKVGQDVRIAKGSFMALAGKLKHLDVRARVCVLLEPLGRSVSVASRCEALIAAA